MGLCLHHAEAACSARALMNAVISYGDTRHCTHDDGSADIEKAIFKSAHETLSM
jgi:hypothetical protein